MDETKPLNNAGGRTLIGNYAEERYLSEKLSLETNYNKTDANASLNFAKGNTSLITSDTSMLKASVAGESFAAPQPFAAPHGRRGRRAIEAARAQAAQEVDTELAEANAATQEAMVSSTQAMHGNSPSCPDGLATIALDEAVLNAAPTSVWSDQGKRTKRSTAFTDGIRTDELIASGQL